MPAPAPPKAPGPKSAKTPTLKGDLVFRGLLHQVTDEALLTQLDVPSPASEPITFYGGFDPTASSLHIGSLLLMCTIKRFQDAGHRPIVLAGGATGLIGDPGGKAEERALITKEEVRANIDGIKEQLVNFLTLETHSNKSSFLVDNSSFYESQSILDFLRDVGKHFTINQMVAKESVKTRFERLDQGISFTEFSYMLLQAYDFLNLYQDHGCTLQLGGSDQWGNITMGVELIRKVEGAQAYGLTSPLVVKADGTKFGKTESGTLWLDPARTSPYKLYQYFLQAQDATVGTYLRYFTFISHEEIIELDQETATHPEKKVAPTRLAEAVCNLIHGTKETARAKRASAALFSGDLRLLEEAELLDAFDDVPSGAVPRDQFLEGYPIIDALVTSGLCASKGEARRSVSQGGAYVNGSRVEEETAALSINDLLCEKYIILRRGKRDHYVLKAQ